MARVQGLSDWAMAASDWEVLDVSSWSTYGTDSLTLYPPDLRMARIDSVAEQFGLSADAIVALVLEANHWRTSGV